MNTFCKVVLGLFAAVIALKMLPVFFGLGGALGGLILGLLVVGVSVLAAGFIALLVLAAVLAPIWVPVLLVVGIIALCRRDRSPSVA